MLTCNRSVEGQGYVMKAGMDDCELHSHRFRRTDGPTRAIPIRASQHPQLSVLTSPYAKVDPIMKRRTAGQKAPPRDPGAPCALAWA